MLLSVSITRLPIPIAVASRTFGFKFSLWTRLDYECVRDTNITMPFSLQLLVWHWRSFPPWTHSTQLTLFGPHLSLYFFFLAVWTDFCIPYIWACLTFLTLTSFFLWGRFPWKINIHLEIHKKQTNKYSWSQHMFMKRSSKLKNSLLSLGVFLLRCYNILWKSFNQSTYKACSTSIKSSNCLCGCWNSSTKYGLFKIIRNCLNCSNKVSGLSEWNLLIDRMFATKINYSGSIFSASAFNRASLR